jgi:cbb3-type cytochrome oxidase subunit 3
MTLLFILYLAMCAGLAVAVWAWRAADRKRQQYEEAIALCEAARAEVEYLRICLESAKRVEALEMDRAWLGFTKKSPEKRH